MHELIQQEEKNEQVNWRKYELDNEQKPTRSPSTNQANCQYLNDERAWRVGKDQRSIEKEHGHIHLQEQDFGQKIKRTEDHSVQ